MCCFIITTLVTLYHHLHHIVMHMLEGKVIQVRM